jgi:D-proline reductase (dithiol) PrdB
VSLTARHLEENGIPTVVIGSGRDIVEHCAVPRFLFVDFPLGNPCGIPYDRDMQAAIARQAVELLESAGGPQTTVRAPFDWNGDPNWRGVYNYVGSENQEDLRAEGERRRTRMAKRPNRKIPNS